MKISYKWLQEYLDLDLPAKEVAEQIERSAVEVDSVTVPMDGLKKIVVGEVVSLEDHPDSDHLHVCQVDVGEAENLQIVCGAPNVAAGKKVIVALPGSRIAGNVKIKKSKMRGIESSGMLCSLEELGMAKDVVPKEWADGIYFLPDDAVLGEPVFAYLGMDDALIDIDVTPNRGDMLSIFGTVKDLAAIYDLQDHFEVKELTEDGDQATDKQITVVADPDLAPTYKVRVINNVKVKPSPVWLQIRLWQAGIRPINNVVDVTNYVLWKYGQPLHAYDLAKITGEHLEVRKAKENETIQTLDEKEYELTSTDTIIADQNGAVGIAGIMGGLNSEVTDQTTDIVLEAAVFDPISTRKTARHHVIHTEAAQRFERGINVAGVQRALDEAAAWIQDLAAGNVAKGTINATELQTTPPTISITVNRVNQVLGTDLTEADIIAIFDRLGFETQVNNEAIAVTVPLRRWDIFEAADLYEEIARIYGYDELPTTLPVAQETVGSLTAAQKITRASRHVLEGLGLTQAISYSLTTADKAKMFLMQPSELTKLNWPMTQDHSVLRMSLVSGLLDDVAYNNAHHVKNVALYEQGRVFYKTDVDQIRPVEVEHLAGVISGEFGSASWNQAAQPADFYQLKGIVNQLLTNLSVVGPVEYVATAEFPELHPGKTAKILVHEHEVGFIGEIHPSVAKQFKIGTTYAFELNLQELIDMPKQDSNYEPVAKYPAIKRDIAIEVAKDVTNSQVMAIINKRGGKYLKEVNLFDVYAGSKVAAGRKSLAYSLTYVNPKDTLKDEEVNAAFDKIKKHLTEELNASIR